LNASKATDTAQKAPKVTKKNVGQLLNRPVREMTFLVCIPDEANPTAAGRYEDISVLGELGANLKSDFLAICLETELRKKRYTRMIDPAMTTSMIEENKCALTQVIARGSGGNKYKNGPFRACHSCRFNSTRLCVRLYRPNDADEAVFVVFPKHNSGTTWINRGFWTGS
jgi:hypothetical protein